MRLTAGSVADPALPLDRLTAEEAEGLRQLTHRLLEAEAVVGQVRQAIELSLLRVRDRRGLAGRVEVDPETGRLGPLPSPAVVPDIEEVTP